MTREYVEVRDGKAKIEASCFIIPNGAPKLEGIFDYARAERKKMLEKFAELNGKKFDPEDNMVQIWIHSDGISENFSGHGFRVMVDGRKTFGHIGTWLPASLLVGHKEGDVIDIVIPASYHDVTEDDVSPFELHVKMHLNQRGYRYSDSGDFEDLLEKVIAAD